MISERNVNASDALTIWGWLSLGAGLVFVFLQVALQATPAVIHDGLVEELALTNLAFGSFSSSFYYSYILLQIPSGMLALRFGPRRLMAAGAAVCAITAFGLSESHGFWMAEGSRILMGVGAAPAVVCTMMLGSRWFPKPLFPMVVAVTEGAGMVGAALGQEVLGFVVDATGWRTGMLGCAAFSALLAIWIVAVVRNPPSRREVKKLPSLSSLLGMCQSTQVMIPAVAGGLIASAGVAFGLLWSIPFLEMRLGVSVGAASWIASLYFWGTLPGMLGSGWLASRWISPDRGLMGGAIGSAVCLAVILHGPADVWIIGLGMFLLGLANGFYALAFTIVERGVAPELASSALGFANMLIMGLGGWIFQPLMGLLATWLGAEVPGKFTLSILVAAQLAAAGLVAVYRRAPSVRGAGV